MEEQNDSYHHQESMYLQVDQQALVKDPPVALMYWNKRGLPSSVCVNPGQDTPFM